MPLPCCALLLVLLLQADASQAFAVRAVVVRQAWQAAKHPDQEWRISFVDVPAHTDA